MNPRAALLAPLLSAVMGLSACVTVKPWQKEDLARPPLASAQPEVAAQRFEQHARGAREGAEGGTGEAGGGCGCN